MLSFLGVLPGSINFITSPTAIQKTEHLAVCASTSVICTALPLLLTIFLGEEGDLVLERDIPGLPSSKWNTINFYVASSLREGRGN